MSSSPIPSPFPDAGVDRRGTVAADGSIAGGAVIGVRLARVPVVQVLTANSNTVAITAARMHLSGASDFKLTSTPTVAAGMVVGQEVQLVNTGTKLVALQGDALAGSTLKLRSRTVSLAPGCSVSVVWDGTNWIEVARATFGSANEHHVGDFGAVGDSTAFGAVGTDDTAALQKAVDAAAIDGLPVVLASGLIYRTTAELLVVTPLHIKGSGKYLGGIRGTGVGPRAVIAVDGGTLHLSDVALYAGREYVNGVYILNATGSVIERCRIYQSTGDGLIIVNSDSCRILDVLIELCGTLYHTANYGGGMPANIRSLRVGTVAKTAGLFAVVGTGTAFLSMGIRDGDFMSTSPTNAGNAAAEWFPIVSVEDDTHLTLGGIVGAATTASGLDYTVHVGDGHHDGSRADCNNHRFDGLFTRNIAGCGLSIRGLYGHSVTNLQSDACGAYPVAVASNLLVSIGNTFRKCYFELNSAADNFFIGYAPDIYIDQVNGTGQPVLAGGGLAWGVIRGMQNASDPGRIDPLGVNPVDYVPSAVLINNCILQGKLRGWAYTLNGPGVGSLTIKDNQSNAWAAVSGTEPPLGGSDPNAVGFDFDTYTAVTPAAGKWLTRWRNATVTKAGIGMAGDFRTDSSDQSTVNGGFGGSATIDKPSGRFALAQGDTTVTITNVLVTAATKVFWNKLQNDATAVDFKVVAGTGSFVVTASAAAALKIVFDFFLVNQ